MKVSHTLHWKYFQVVLSTISTISYDSLLNALAHQMIQVMKMTSLFRQEDNDSKNDSAHVFFIFRNKANINKNGFFT